MKRYPVGFLSGGNQEFQNNIIILLIIIYSKCVVEVTRTDNLKIITNTVTELSYSDTDKMFDIYYFA